MPGAKHALSALLNKNVLKEMLKCFPEWCQTYIKSGSSLFLFQHVTSHAEEMVFNQIFHSFLRIHKSCPISCCKQNI